MSYIIITSIISGFIGYILPYCFKLISYVIRLKKTDDLCGKWYSYTLCAEKNEIIIYSGIVKVKKGILSLYKTEATENGLVYKGTISIENNHLLCIQKNISETRSETSFIRLDYSAFSMRDKLHGYWLSYDADNKISCGVAVFSKVKLSNDDVLKDMKSSSINYENIFLRLCV